MSWPSEQVQFWSGQAWLHGEPSFSLVHTMPGKDSPPHYSNILAYRPDPRRMMTPGKRYPARLEFVERVIDGEPVPVLWRIRIGTEYLTRVQ